VGQLLRTTQRLSGEGAMRSVPVSPGQVIMSIAATVGRPIIVGIDACIHDGFVVFDRHPRLDPGFLVHHLRQMEPYFTGQGQTGTQANINTQIVEASPLSLPPWAEQRAIAAVLDTIDDAIQKTEQIIAKLQQVKQGLLHDLLTRGIDDNGELRDPERHPEQFQDSPLGRIPKGWRVARIGDIIESHQAGIYKDRSEYGEGSNIVGVADLFRHDSLDGQQFRLVRLTASEQSEFRLEAGDLVYAESSLVLDGIAKTLAVTEAGAGTTFAWHTRRLRPNRKSVRGAFLAFALGLPRTRAFVASRATQTALTGIPVAAYFETPVILPPVTEQDAISAMVMALEHQIKAEFAHSDKVKALKRGLAHDLLTGRVRTTSLPEFAA
jgi:type I restriction enzyme S subunit